jgi:hypothetical protein
MQRNVLATGRCRFGRDYINDYWFGRQKTVSLHDPGGPAGLTSEGRHPIGWS